jgi:hypothetical protein
MARGCVRAAQALQRPSGPTDSTPGLGHPNRAACCLLRPLASSSPASHPLLTRKGNDWTTRFPLVVEAVNHLKVRSCLIDGEVVCCDEKGVAAFQPLRHRRNEPAAPSRSRVSSWSLPANALRSPVRLLT